MTPEALTKDPARARADTPPDEPGPTHRHRSPGRHTASWFRAETPPREPAEARWGTRTDTPADGLGRNRWSPTPVVAVGRFTAAARRLAALRGDPQ